MKKIVGIIVCMLLIITTVFQAVGIEYNSNNTLNKNHKDNLYVINYNKNIASDDEIKEVVTEWINNYCGSTGDLYLCNNEKNFIKTRLGGTVTPSWRCWDFGNSLPDGIHWRWPWEDFVIGGKDLAVFRGHGGKSGLKFRCDATDTRANPEDAAKLYGDRDLEWIVFACCKGLHNDNRWIWANAMDGLHLILGYKTNAVHATYVTEWIKQCTSLGRSDPSHRIVWSWFKACDRTQVSGRVARAIGEAPGYGCEYLWGEGIVLIDPIPNEIYTSWYHRKGGRMDAPSNLIQNTVESMTLYKIIPRDVNPDYVEEIGEFFDISGDVLDGGNDEDSYFIAEGTQSLEVSKIEGIDYGDSVVLWQPTEVAPDLPSLDEAREIAINFLTDTGLMPDDVATYPLPNASYADIQEQGIKGSPEIIEEFPTDIQVEFKRKNIEGIYPIVGAGCTCLVYVSEGGVVSGFTKIWRDVEPEGTVSIFNAKTAHNLFDNYGSKVTLTGCPVSDYDEYDVTDSLLGYYEKGFGEEQDYLIPVYVLFIDFHVEGEIESDIIIVPASYDFLPIASITNPSDDSAFNYGEVVAFAGEASYGLSPYTFEWWSDFNGYLGSGQIFSTSELSPIIRDGRKIPHTITLYVTDSNGRVSQDMISVKIFSPDNQPPNTPTIVGETYGNVGREYTYTISTIDPDNDEVNYYIDIVDGEESGVSDWFGPYPSGQEVTIKYSWEKPGDYLIGVKANDTNDAESDWGTIFITMPRNRAIQNIIFQWFSEKLPILSRLFQRLI